MITVYTLTYNEELMIQFMIDHYRARFPNCRIVVYDNMSTDNTVKIARANDCEIIPFDTGNQFQDRRHMEIKNTAWKIAKTDWVLTSDLDEILDINEKQLRAEETSGATIIKTAGYDMINMADTVDISSMHYGVKSPLPGKFCLFNKKYITDMNFGPGAHTAHPCGTLVFSQKTYPLYHYNAINENLTIKKFRVYNTRLSPENKQRGWGSHYAMTPEEIRQEYRQERKKAVKVR